MFAPRPLLVSFALLSFLAAQRPDLARASEARVIEQPHAILLFGNSFTRGLRKHLSGLFEAAGVNVRIKTRAKSGWTLERHANHPRLEKTLAARPWDVVVLQEQSDGIDEDRYPAARFLDERISAVGATTVFFMTWRERGAPLADYDALRGEIGGTVGYVPIAFELERSVAPVGWAFRAAIAQNGAVDLWKRDDKHADDRGRYLAASTIYATITGNSPVALEWWPGKLEEAEAAALRQLAAETVLLDPAEWNVELP